MAQLHVHVPTHHVSTDTCRVHASSACKCTACARTCHYIHSCKTHCAICTQTCTCTYCVHSACARTCRYYNDCVDDCRSYLSSPRRVMISACESLTVLPSRLMNGPVMQRFPAVNSTHVINQQQQVRHTGNTTCMHICARSCTFLL